MRKIALIGLLLISAAAWSHAATVTVGPSDCSAATVNAAINASTTHDGDTVLLTCTGTINWASTGTVVNGGPYAVAIPATKGITLQVQGGTNTPKTSANFPLVVTVASDTTAIFVTVGPSRAVSRISGFRFAPNGGTPDPFLLITGAGTGTSGLGGFRVDNNYFDTISGNRMLAVWSGKLGDTGNLFGLIDNDTFHNTWRGDDPAYGPYNIQIWNYWYPAGHQYCFGCDGWTNNDFAYGSANFTFVEDNLFEQTTSAPGHMRHYISAELGARYVSRHNTFINNYPDNNADLHDAHGLCLVSSNGVGSRGGEIYANNISGSGFNRATALRGGSWLVHDNVITSGHAIELDEYRANGDGQCESLALGGLMPPWPVPANADWNANAAWVPAVSNTNYYPLPQQIFYTFLWSNKTPSGTLINPSSQTSLEQQYIVNNRDYCCDGASTQPPAVGSHTFSYTPYTYPHPLQGGGGGGGSAPAPPSGLTVSVH